MARINKSVAASQYCVIRCIGEDREERKKKRDSRNERRETKERVRGVINYSGTDGTKKYLEHKEEKG
jgi:hypothetical protein